MAQIKRQLSKDFNQYDDYKQQKISTEPLTTNPTYCPSEERTISHFENLSNELFYEIFEYLDYCHVYDAFSNLNQRFKNLLTSSNLPIKINLSFMSKSTFKYYNEHVFKTCTTRIISLHISDVFMYDCVLSSMPKLSEFQQLRTLILDNIESKYLDDILNQLRSLSSLSSLVIDSVDEVESKNSIYRQVFLLSALKYCKLSLKGLNLEDLLTVCTNIYSRIERLIIVNEVQFYELHSLLSYVPQLRYLSIGSLQETWERKENISRNLLNHLTHFSLKTRSLNFDRLIQLITNYFQTVQVLQVTVEGYNVCEKYINAENWQQLITSCLSNLRILDIHINMFSWYHDDSRNIETYINQFRSSFWIERKWFFTYQLCEENFGIPLLLYSTDPYRRKHYTLYKQVNRNISLHSHESDLKSVEHVYIRSPESLNNFMNSFPNTTELIFENEFTHCPPLITTILNGIIPLKQITKLVIDCYDFCFQKLINILCYTSNLQTLVIKSIPFYQHRAHDTFIEGAADFQIVSNRNTIRIVICDSSCNLEQIKLLVTLCPRMQHLSISVDTVDLEIIVRFLLEKNNPNTRHLYSLHFSDDYENHFDKTNTLIKSEKLLEDYSLMKCEWDSYLWW